MAMSKVPAGNPLREELRKLPRWACVAFAARCARRAQPMFTLKWKDAPREHVEAIERAITAAEASARVGFADASILAAVAAAADADAAAATDAAYAAEAAEAAIGGGWPDDSCRWRVARPSCHYLAVPPQGSAGGMGVQGCPGTTLPKAAR